MKIDALVQSGKIRDPHILVKLKYLGKDAKRAFKNVRRYSHELRLHVLDQMIILKATNLKQEFKEILDKIPETLKYMEFHKLYLYSEFWSNSYTVAKYRFENFSIGPERLFGLGEAKLVKLHSEKCYQAALQLNQYINHPW